MLLTPPPVARMARGVLGASVVPATWCESWAPVTPRAPRAPVSSAVLCTGPPPWPWAASVSLVSVRRRRALQRTVGVTAALVSLPRPLPCLLPLSLPLAVRGCAWRNTAATRSNGDGGAGATGDADDPSPRRPTVAVLLRGTGELRPTGATAAAPLGASVAAVFAGGWSEVPSCTRALEAAVIASRSGSPPVCGVSRAAACGDVPVPVCATDDPCSFASVSIVRIPKLPEWPASRPEGLVE